jgi:uncharacterized protein YdeI (YjbR/CyaY-like superfamily)
MNPEIDKYLNDSAKWKAEQTALRHIILETLLNEELKWGVPCYTFNKANIVLIHGFKDYCAILFHKGVLLSDPDKVLITPTESSQSARQIRFTNLSQIEALSQVITAYVFEAIELEKSGAKVSFKPTEAYETPEELKTAFTSKPELEEAFYKLTPGRQRGYLLHFGSAKQSATKTSRIEACIARIKLGKGLTDCICGLSKRFPSCDGSHKSLK